MNVNKIIDLNDSFYNKVWKQFSNTRQYPLSGWNPLIPIIKRRFDRFSILDVGCGNGRFYGFLKNKFDSFDYTGMDNNKHLLDIFKRFYPKASVIRKNIFDNVSSLNKRFDVIVAFGVTHHVPGKSFRIEWFNNICSLLNSGGLAIFTFWDFLYKKPTPAPKLEKNDFYLGWDNKKDVMRYCHFYSKEELISIRNILSKKDIKLISTYKHDGNKNVYLIFEKGK